MKICTPLLCALALSTPLAAEPSKAEPPKAEPPTEFESFALVILRTGEKSWPTEKEPREALFKQHIGHFVAMARAGKLVVAGPLGEQDDKTARGICLYRTSVEEARKLAGDDPAVKAGVFRLEVMKWATEKGAMKFPVAEKMAKGEP